MGPIFGATESTDRGLEPTGATWHHFAVPTRRPVVGMHQHGRPDVKNVYAARATPSAEASCQRACESPLLRHTGGAVLAACRARC